MASFHLKFPELKPSIFVANTTLTSRAGREGYNCFSSIKKKHWSIWKAQLPMCEDFLFNKIYSRYLADQQSVSLYRKNEEIGVN